MLIAVNTRMLQANKMEGIGYFTFESFRRITAKHTEHDFVFIFDRPYDPSFIFSDNIKPIIISPPARHPLLWCIWYEWSLKRLLKRLRPDLFVATDGFLALGTDVKSLAVIHDINFEHYPEDLPFFNRTYYRYFFRKFAHSAHRIATVSEYSAKDIAKTYSIPESKLDIVYNGASENFLPVTRTDKQNTRERFSKGKPYFLFIGSLHKRKNIATLLKAFEIFKINSGSDFKLILAGTKRWWSSDMEIAYNSMNHREDVIFTGRIPDEDLYRLAGAAFALTYVSIFEGFGIPIVEAFRCEVPVICSNTTSMPEVAGDAALYVDPFSAESIAKGMTDLFRSEQLQTEMVEKGKKRSKLFTWNNTAESLWHSMMRTVEGI
jgi:glycosyltransferase involved in cell wall biosynthesis